MEHLSPKELVTSDVSLQGIWQQLMLADPAPPKGYETVTRDCLSLLQQAPAVAETHQLFRISPAAAGPKTCSATARQNYCIQMIRHGDLLTSTRARAQDGQGSKPCSVAVQNSPARAGDRERLVPGPVHSFAATHTKK